MKHPNPYECTSNTCDTCIFNETCANEILCDQETGLYLPIPESMKRYLEE